MIKKEKKAKEEKRSENYFRRALENNRWTFPRRVKKKPSSNWHLKDGR